MKNIEISEEDFFWLVIGKINKAKKDEMEMLYQPIKFLVTRNEEERELFYRKFGEKMSALDFSKVDGLNQHDLKFIKAWVIGMGEWYYDCVLENPNVVKEGKGKTFTQLLYIKENVEDHLKQDI
tara:strand:+ start:69 stop:440 length:372 start_codon:yes stop_codon:yes gene_type:complete